MKDIGVLIGPLVIIGFVVGAFILSFIFEVIERVFKNYFD